MYAGGWWNTVRHIEAHLRYPQLSAQDPVNVGLVRPSHANPCTLQAIAESKESFLRDEASTVSTWPHEKPCDDIPPAKQRPEMLCVVLRKIRAVLDKDRVHLVQAGQLRGHGAGPVEQIHKHPVVQRGVVRRPLLSGEVVPPPHTQH